MFKTRNALTLTLVLLAAPNANVAAQETQPATTSTTSSPAQPGPEQITLQDAVKRALAHNPNLTSALAQVRRSEALVREARANSLPSLNGVGTYTRIDADRMLGERVIAFANQLSANVTLSVPLIAPQRWTQWARAGDAVDVSKASADDIRRVIGVATARAYLAVVSQQRVMDVRSQAVGTAVEHGRFAVAQYKGGIGTRIDEVRALQEVALAETQLQSSYAALAKAKEGLGVLVGADASIDVRDDGILPPKLPQETPAIQDAQTQRADVRAAKKRLEVAERALRNDWTAYFPYLIGTFQPFYQNHPTLVTPKTGWQAQLILTVPFYDGGLRYGVEDEHRAAIEDSRAQLESVLRQAKSEVRTAFEWMRRADLAVESARRGAKLAHEALELANLAYSAGASTNLEVIDAQRRSLDADTATAVAEDAARQARLDLLAASGRFP